MLNSIPSERLDDTVTVHDSYGDEYIAVIDFVRNDNSDVLDDGHYVLELKAWLLTHRRNFDSSYQMRANYAQLS